jgi:hypothetical protein
MYGPINIKKYLEGRRNLVIFTVGQILVGRSRKTNDGACKKNDKNQMIRVF